MVKIRATTFVNAPMERCFRLALSVNLQMDATNDEAVAGITSGLVGPGDRVTWKRALTLLRKEHQSVIELWRPFSFYRETMTDGPFQFYEHDHHFAPLNDGTRIRDEIRFLPPAGIVGRVTERLFLRRQVTRFLEQRNALIKQAAESEEWHRYLDDQAEFNSRTYQAPARTSGSRKHAYAS